MVEGQLLQSMHVISRKRLNEFVDRHPDSKASLAHWYGLMKRGYFANFAQLREIFPSADQVGNLTVFNIGGNKVRLIAAIHYNRQRIYVRAILTHDEYNDQSWKQ
jgi:mRNA interferase HigB